MDGVGYNLYAALLFAGFLGSLVYIAAQEGPPQNWWAVISPIIAGTPTANYLAHPLAAYFFGDAAATTGTAGAISAFAIGAGGPWVARGLIRKAKSFGGNGNGSPRSKAADGSS
jgi:hypothetical protein